MITKDTNITKAAFLFFFPAKKLEGPGWIPSAIRLKESILRTLHVGTYWSNEILKCPSDIRNGKSWFLYETVKSQNIQFST